MPASAPARAELQFRSSSYSERRLDYLTRHHDGNDRLAATGDLKSLPCHPRPYSMPDFCQLGGERARYGRDGGRYATATCSVPVWYQGVVTPVKTGFYPYPLSAWIRPAGGPPRVRAIAARGATAGLSGIAHGAACPPPRERNTTAVAHSYSMELSI